MAKTPSSESLPSSSVPLHLRVGNAHLESRGLLENHARRARAELPASRVHLVSLEPRARVLTRGLRVSLERHALRARIAGPRMANDAPAAAVAAARVVATDLAVMDAAVAVAAVGVPAWAKVADAVWAAAVTRCARAANR